MPRRIPTLLLFLLGFATMIYMVTLTRDTVFFSGDGGMKFILVQKFARGDFAPLVQTGAPEWVNQIWHEGFFPFDPPFGYQQAVGMFVAYPLYFPLLTAPFYALLGYRGLYVLPAAAVIGVWLVTLRAIRLARVSKWAEWFGLASLILGSSLSLYAAMFWEHSLSVFLVAFTLPYIVRSLDGSIRWPWALAYGLLSALSVFLRAETGALLLIVGAAGLWINGRARWQASVGFGVGLALGVGSFLLANQAAYGIPTGVHSLQLLERDLLSMKRVRDMLSDMQDMAPLLVSTTPLAVAALIVWPVAWVSAADRPSLRRQLGWSTVITLAVFLLTPLLLPSDGHKQWGARFYLILLPWLTLTLVFIVESLLLDAGIRRAGEESQTPVHTAGERANLHGLALPLWRSLAGGLLIAGAVAGVLYNGVVGIRTLRDDYAERVLPALEIVRAEDAHTIVVTHQWIAQELASLYFDRDFYWLRDDEEMPELLDLLRARGVDDALYLTYAPGSSRHRPIDFGELLGEYGSYWVYRVNPVAAAH